GRDGQCGFRCPERRGFHPAHCLDSRTTRALTECCPRPLGRDTPDGETARRRAAGLSLLDTPHIPPRDRDETTALPEKAPGVAVDKDAHRLEAGTQHPAVGAADRPIIGPRRLELPGLERPVEFLRGY